MFNKKRSSEMPIQDYGRIQLMFLPNAHSNGKLFTDYAFPPDQSSLTYVYSGDDRYEKMIFKRPKEIVSYATLAGVGGVYDTPFPWKRWKKCGWFEAAIAVVSLSVKQMDQLIPGYRNFDQSLLNDYIGCFCFKLWRFGDWIDIVVDDHLPTLNNQLLYCPAFGTPKEFWGPLVEKAYAKCKKTYEANECGRTLDAITDLTGAICEFFTPHINPPENLFHVLYKSSVNRSHILCWRNDKLLTPTGFIFDSNADKMLEDTVDGRSMSRYLHIVTATTKFPLSDGRMVEMVRVMSPYTTEPIWNGKFADRDEISWTNVNTDFCARYKPLSNKHDNEYWMTLEDFRCNFGGLIICSSETPYTTEGLNLERCYRKLSDGEIKSGRKSLFPTKERRRSDGKHGCYAGTPKSTFLRNYNPTLQSYRYRKQRNSHSETVPLSFDSEVAVSAEQEILVREHSRTVKVDNTRHRGYSVGRVSESSRHVEGHNTEQPDTHHGTQDSIYSSAASCLKKLHTSIDKNKRDYISKINENSCAEPLAEPSVSSPNGDKFHTANSIGQSSKSDVNFVQNRSGSIVSNCSLLSDCQSTFSASDITLNMQSGCSRENSLKRPKSAPGTSIARKNSSGSLSNMTVNHFVATSSDNFRSHGSWRLVLNYTGIWEKSDSGVSSVNMKLHSRNPRIILCILHSDAVNQVVASGYHGKSHVIISLLQDYRHGAPTANSLLVPIGFSVYKTKNPSKDEKRSLSKLCHVGESDPANEFREITCRFDLLPGSYFIVPYCLSENHSGQYLVRVLAEKDPVAGRTGCSLS